MDTANGSSSNSVAIFRNGTSTRGFLSGEFNKGMISRTFSISSSEADDDTNIYTAEQGLLLAKNERGVPCQEPTPYDEGAASLDLRVPIEKAHTPRSKNGFFMESMIRRDESKTRFIMYQQSAESGAHPMFCAEKYPPSDGGQIILKSVAPPRHSGFEPFEEILGSLMKTTKRRKNSKKAVVISYELVLHDKASSRKTPVASIEYEKVSVARSLVEGGRPRYAQVRIAGRPPVETKEPSRQTGGQRVLDFGGRGRETSGKNMQLVGSDTSTSAASRESRNGSGGCCLQMVKWKDNEFNVDFGAPFDAIHAFAFALAQFDF